MSDTGFTLFGTPIGACGIAWGPDGMIGLQLPGGQRGGRTGPASAAVSGLGTEAAAARDRGGGSADRGLPRRRRRRFRRSAARPRPSRRVRPLGLSPRRARSRPARPRTYGAIAAGLGDPGQARAVGQALGRNPWPIVIPCHRVTAADGRTGGFSAPGGRATKLRLLEIEGALRAETLPLFGGTS